MASRDHIIYAAAPPVVDVRPEYGRPKLDPRMMKQQIAISRFQHKLKDLCPNSGNYGYAQLRILEKAKPEATVRPVKRDVCARTHGSNRDSNTFLPDSPID
jgi:hypothetical protein